MWRGAPRKSRKTANRFVWFFLVRRRHLQYCRLRRLHAINLAFARSRHRHHTYRVRNHPNASKWRHHDRLFNDVNVTSRSLKRCPSFGRKDNGRAASTVDVARVLKNMWSYVRVVSDVIVDALSWQQIVWRFEDWCNPGLFKRVLLSFEPPTILRRFGRSVWAQPISQELPTDPHLVGARHLYSGICSSRNRSTSCQVSCIMTSHPIWRHRC